MDDLKNEFRKFGYVSKCKKTKESFELKIRKGYVPKMENTSTILNKVSQLLGEEYKNVKKLESDEGMMHLIVETDPICSPVTSLI